MKHPHAENMRLYAEDAAETETPWERWEVQYSGVTDHWYSLMDEPAWAKQNAYRRKPNIVKRPYIKIGARWVPEPMREAPADGAQYFGVNALGSIVFASNWNDRLQEKTWLAFGICHLTREAAEAHLAALQELHAQPATMLTEEEALK